MSWNLEGKRVSAKYLGDYNLTVSGIVIESRVALGGRVKHHIALDEPVYMYGTSRERVVVEHEEIESVKEVE